MKARRLVIIVGAHGLGDSAQAFAWTELYLQVLMVELARDPASMVITGGEPGPEVWAQSLAYTFGVSCIACLRDGTRQRDMRPAGRWAEGPVPVGAAAVTRRDRFVIERGCLARQRGADVEVVAFTEAGANERSSSHRRAVHAQGSGLPVIQRIWGETPAVPRPGALLDELRATG